MQISTLNKILSLFLCGCIASLALVLVYSSEIQAFIKKDQLINFLSNSKIGSSILLSVIAASLIMFIGSLITGFAQWTIRGVFFKLKESRVFVSLLGQYRVNERYKNWKEIFIKILNNNPYYSSFTDFSGFSEEDDKHITSLASAILFRHGNQENIRWITTHFATYILSTDFIATSFFVYICILTGFDISPDMKLVFFIVTIGISYLLLVLATFSYLYTYECIFRYSSLIVSKKLLEETDPQVTAEMDK